MSLTALLLVIAAAIVHAVWNLVTKQVHGKLPFFWLNAIASVILYMPVVLWQMMHEHADYNWVVIGFAFGSAVLHIFYFLILQTGYRKADLSVVYPVARGAGPLFSVTGAILLFHERPGMLAICGVLLIVAGVLVMTGLKLKSSTAVTGMQYGLLTGLFIASYTLWDNAGVKQHNVSPVFITFASMVLPSVLLIPVAIKQKSEVRREIKQHWLQILIVAVFQPLSYILVLIALKTTPVSYVAPARELSIVFGVFFGFSLLKEKDSLRRIIASLIILGGIVLLSLTKS